VTGTRPTIAGALLRGYLSTLKRRGLLPAVRELVSEGTREIIDRPPIPFAWEEAASMEELMDAIGRLGGRETVKELALETARTQAGPIVFPFMRTLLALGGATPESIFRHIHRVVALQARGLSVAYTPETPSSGTVELIYSYAPNDFVYASWESVFHLVLEACNVDGAIERSELLDEGRRARIKVRWDPRR